MGDSHFSSSVTPNSVTPHPLPHLLSVARGETPADLLLRNARIINVFSGEIEPADVAIAGGIIAGVGAGYDAKQIVDLNGAYVAPGLIDAHVHIESSLCEPPQFASAVVPRGVTTVVADPHEIANVAGAAGVRFMMENARPLPLRVVFMAPSCVPATSLGTAGATLRAGDLGSLHCHGLAEVMDFPGVIRGDEKVLRKFQGFTIIDGHAPGVAGKALNAYAAAGVGSDHECVRLAEAREKLARGMYVLIREATNARNLDALIPLITPANNRRICLCTDDRTPGDLLGDGSIDHMLRRVIVAGVDPVDAFRLCTLNPSEWFQLHDRGAIAPGRLADLMVFEDLSQPVASRVYVGGKPVAPNGSFNSATAQRSAPAPKAVLDSCHVSTDHVDLRIPARGNRIRVVGSLADQLITESRVIDAATTDGYTVADPSRDLLKMAVIERHRGSGRVGLGFIQGIGLKRGAIAGTVAHDHHNLVVIGCDDRSMMAAIGGVAKMGGGLIATAGDETLASLPLPVAGLMSDRPIGEVAVAYGRLLAAARGLGSILHDPFMA
ncbi:MAG: adenine deaminase, partial [Planctomycetota bacterium]|nr:adenine deaminase [Planctomycetota bacterium]